MNRTELYAFVASLLGDEEIDSDLFDSLLAHAKSFVEEAREWVILRAVNSSLTTGSSDTYLTSKAMPDDFGRWYGETPVQLVDSANNDFVFCREVPLANRFHERNAFGKFYCDYSAKLLYLTGTRSKAYTIYMNYVKESPEITTSVAWVFPTRFHKTLGFLIAAFYKLGVDYDVINNAQGDRNAGFASEGINMMETWDDALQAGMIKGLDEGGGWTPQTVPGFPRGD
jgi:hypothetical protein